MGSCFVGQVPVGHSSPLKDGQGGEGTRLTASNRREPIRILQQRTPAAVIDHLKTATSLSLLCLSFLADTQRLVFYPENQVLWCKLSPRAIYKNSWVCAPVCISHSKEENQNGAVCHLRSSLLSWSPNLPKQTSTKEEKQSTFIL